MRWIMRAGRGGESIPFDAARPSPRAASESEPLPSRILIVRLSHLGDVVCTLGLAHALHTAFPAADIAWAVQPEFAGLVEGEPGVGRVIVFRRRAGPLALLGLRRELRAFAPDLAVDAQGNLKSALVTRLSGAPRRAGFARADWREPLGARVLTEPAAPVDRAGPGPRGEPHLVARVAHLARAVAGDVPFEPEVRLRPEEEAAGEAALAARLSGAGAPLLLHLSSPEDVRGWPLERWRTLLEHADLVARPVLVLSGPGEEHAGRAVAEALPGRAHWTGQKGLRELAALFRAAARRGGELVACDTGPMHLAWAAGLPVRVLEGPQVARRTGPWPLADAPGSPHRELRAEPAPECAPCLARRCTHPRGPVCMTDLAPERVLAALDAARGD